MKSLVKRIALNAGTLVSGGVASSAIGLVSFSLLARELGTELFGVLALVQVYAIIIDGLINFQSWQALIKYGTSFQLAGQRQELGKLYSFGFLVDVSTAALATLVGVSLPLLGLGELLGWESVKTTMASIFAMGIILNIEGTPTAIFRMHDKYRIFVTKGLIGAILRLVLIVGGTIYNQDIWYFFYAILFTQLVMYLYFLVVSLVFLRDNSIPLSWPQLSFTKIRKTYPGILNFIMTTNLHGSLRMLTLRLDTIIVDTYLGSAATGLYQVAKQFSRVFTQASQPLYKVIYPELTKLWELGKLVEFGQTIRQFSIYASIFGAVTWLAFFLAPNTVIYYTVGEEYYDSIPTLLFYLAGVVLSVGTFPLTPALLAMGKATETFNVLLISTVVYFCSFFLMINEIGLLGAGISYLIFYIVWSTLMFFKIKKFL